MEAEPDREVGQDSAGRKLDVSHSDGDREALLMTSHNWLRLEDDDDSSVDLLAPSSGNELTPRESKNNDGGIIGLGDVFSGHKQMKRCWLINDNDQMSFDIKISLDWSKQIRVIVGEVCVDSTGLLLPQIDELPNRPHCVAQYKKTSKPLFAQPGDLPMEVGVRIDEKTGKTGTEATEPAAVVPAMPNPSGAVDGNLVTSSDRPAAPLMRGGIADGVDIGLPSQVETIVVPTPLETALSSSGAVSAPLKSLRKLPAGLTKEKSGTLMNWAAVGSNLNPELESDCLLGWDQLKEGAGGGGTGTGIGTSSGAGNAGGGNTSKSRRAVGGSRGSQSLSYLCGRQWGQDGVSAELCGAAGGADFDGDGASQDAFASALELEVDVNRPFIGATSRAVKASRATKSFAKLNNMKPPSTTEKKKKLPREFVDHEVVPLMTSAECTSTSSLHGVRDSFKPPLVAVVDSFDQMRRLRSADSRSASIAEVEEAEEPLLSLLLKPLERVQVTFVVCPSSHYIDGATGGAVGGQLVDRDIPLVLNWKQNSAIESSQAGASHSLQSDLSAASGRHRVTLHFRTCSSLISVVPSNLSVYELGMCSVGEHRTVALEVRNDSDLPTIVFPLVESDVLDLSELEVRIPPQESRQIKVGFLAKTEDPEYWDKVVFLNGYNADCNKEVRLKSRNVDTQQVLLHSMFYKLVTYNNLRQLQVHFDRCLINMPNLRVFSIKNVHSKPLRLSMCWNAKSGIRLFLVISMTAGTGRDSIKSDASSVTQRSTKSMSTEYFAGWQLPLVEGGDPSLEAVDFPSSSKFAGGALERVRGGSSSSSQQLDDIEDMKWGDDPHDLGKFGKYRRSMSMQAVKYPPAGGGVGSSGGGGGGGGGGGVGASSIESHVGMSGDDLSVNYGGRGGGAMYEGKSAAQTNSSRDILSVLDLSQSAPPVNAPGNNGSAGEVGEDKFSIGGRRSNSEGGGGAKEVRFKLLPSIGENVEPSAGTPQSLATPGTFRSSTAHDENVDVILRQFDNEEFPFGILEETDAAEGSSAPTSLSDGRRSRRFFDEGPGSEDLRKLALRSKERPHSIGSSTFSSYASGAAGLVGGAGTGMAAELPSGREREKSEAEKRVKLVQKAYADLRYMIDNAGNEDKSGLKELQPDACPIVPGCLADGARSEISVSVEIPVATSYRFALLYQPQQRADAEDIDEYMQVQKSEEVHIHLPDVNATDVSSSLNLNSILYDTSSSHMPDDLPHSHDGGLRPRSLPIRASLVRSEMVVIQKNISFGRTVLGEKSSRGVTVVNRSSVPCLYTISKSGSISSGFLQVPGGRKGLIPAFSSKVIEFIFRPTLPGNFEEVLLINNVLNPRDTQTVTIKAKVSHTETFVITKVEEPSDAPDATSPVEDVEAKQHLDSDLATFYKNQLSEILDSVAEASYVKSISSYLGSGVVGDASSLNLSNGATCAQLCFRIKNVTSKARQFIVDATHAHSVELLVVAAPPLSSPPPVDTKAKLFVDPDLTPVSDVPVALTAPIVLPAHSPLPHMSVAGTAELAATTPFEPIPEVLQSVLSLRCRFSSELVQGRSASAGDGKDGTLSADERKTLEDSLEQFQQKLKIAIRKNKPEKIEKYQKKIDKVIASLQSNKKAAAPQPEIAEVSIVEGGEIAVAPIVADPERATHPPLPAVAAPVLNSGDIADTSGNNINPNETQPPSAEALVPSASDAQSAGPTAPVPPQQQPQQQQQSEESEVSYHFQLEPEQERVVRVTLSFLPGAGYRYWTGVLPFHGFLRIFECKNEDHVKIVRYGALIQSTRLVLPAGVPAPSSGVLNDAAAKGLSADLLELSGAGAPSVAPNTKVSPLLATVAQWSSLPTRDIYPKYRQLPQNLLPMCIKLVRASKDRVMHGSLSVASLVEQPGSLHLSVDEGFSAKISTDYSTYNSKRHGSIHFVLGNGDAGTGSFDSDFKAGQPEVLNFESLSALAAGSKVDFSVQWRPPLDLGGGKASASSSAAASETGVEESGTNISAPAFSASLRIIGAVKVQLRISDQAVGPSLSIPFIGVLEHTSVLAVSRYFTFEEVSVGSYRTAQIPLANTSHTEELHYIVSSEEVAPGCKAMGTVDIVSGQAGIIPPGGTKQLQLLFSASAAGKYEQKLWIRNIRDSFDQKRVVVQANVSLAQTKFVVFPDLETAANSFGKYKPIDLGLVQIQSADGAASLLPLLPPLEQRCFYELRIQNVSGKSLCVTAVSNLKSQCFIYGDDNLSQLAIYCPLPVGALTTLYVVIRPAIVPSGSQLMSGADATSSIAEDAPHVDPVANEGKSKVTGGRDLVGGIKLVFFPAEHASVPNTPRGPDPEAAERSGGTGDGQLIAPLTPSPYATVDASPRKLFESAISFRATVGKSTLSLRAPEGCEMQHVVVPKTFALQADYFVGRFELKNLSKLFPVEYAYILASSEECIGAKDSLEAESAHRRRAISDLAMLPPAKKADLQVRILDERVNYLPPGESKWVSYIIRHPLHASGVALYPVRVANTSTMEVSALSLAVYLDSSAVKATSPLAENGSEKSSPSPVKRDGEHLATEESEAAPSFESPVALPLKPTPCNTAIWVYQHNHSKVNALAAVPASKVGPVPAGGAEDPPAPTETDQHTHEGTSADLLSANPVQFLVQGTSGGELCSWTYVNDKNKSVTFFPASDLPVSVTLSAVVAPVAGGSVLGGEGDVGAFPTARHSAPALSMSGSASSAYSRKISPALLRWRRSLRRCGGAFTVEAGGTVRVVVSARRGAALTEEQLAALGGTRRLEVGKGGQLQGVVVFLQAAHSLQSLFDATPVKDKEKVRDHVLSATGGKTPSSAKEDGKQPQETAVKAATSFKSKPVAATARTISEIAADQIELLPIVSIATLSCTVAVPLLTMPEGDVSLGKKRCGQFARFEFSVENQSDVDLPCCIDNLPAWMKIERYQASLLAKRQGNSGDNSVAADGDVGSASLSLSGAGEPFLDLSASALDVHSQSHSLSEWSSPRRADIRAGWAERSLGAQKLHWWLATNGATISSQQSSFSASQAVSGDRERESESNGNRHRRGSKESIAMSEPFSIGEATGFSTNATEDDNPHSPPRPSAEFADENFADHQHSSLEVNHEQFLHQYQTDLTLDAHDLDLFKLHQSLLRDANDALVANMKLFAVPARSRVRLAVAVQVPTLPESELLQHSLRIKNLTTAVIAAQQLSAGSTTDGSGKYLLDKEGSVLVTDQKELVVRLQVDATRALELITAIDEPFVVLEASSEQQQGRESRSSSYMRLLKDPFLVPPPVEISAAAAAAAPGSGDVFDHGTESAAANIPVHVEAKSKVSKTHCRFSIKNKLASSLRVQATITLNPDVVELLDMKVKFQTNNSSVIDLEPEEACAVKIRVLPRLDGRMTGMVLSTPAFLPSTGNAEESKKKVTISVEDSTLSRDREGEKSGETGPRPELKKANSRPDVIAAADAASKDATGGCGDPVLLGTVRIAPSVSRPPSSLGWNPDTSTDNAAEEALHSQDTLILSIVGYLRPNATVTTSLVMPYVSPIVALEGELLPPPPLLEFKSFASVSARADEEYECVPPVTPVRRMHVAAANEEGKEAEAAKLSLVDPKQDVDNRGLPPQPPKPLATSSGVSPVLAIKNNGLSVFVSNPSKRPLNYVVKTQTYRHAGMRLRLPGATAQDVSEADSDAFDTFCVEATPAQGTLAPSSLSRINLRLVAGDPSQAVKTSTTLTADIPDVQMRERRLRSHHGRDHTTSSSSSSAVGTIAAASGSSSNVNLLVNGTGIAGASSENVSSTVEGGIAAENEAVVVSNKPVASFSGPFTLACMPIEVWDRDYPAHPPRIVHAYLSCDVPLPVLVTQGLRDAPRQKSQSFHVPAAEQDIVLVLPSMQSTEAMQTPPPLPQDSGVAFSDKRLIQLHGEECHSAPEETGDICTLSVGQQMQRKEALEWPLLLENTSTTKSISYSISSVFSGDADGWLTLGQSGGVVAPQSQTSLMIYFRRSVAPGSYVTYLLVENRDLQADSVVIRVAMEVVLDAKRASAMSNLSMSSLPQLNSAASLAAKKRDRGSGDNLAALGEQANPAVLAAAPSPTFQSVAEKIHFESNAASGSSEWSLAQTPTLPSPPRLAYKVRPVFHLKEVSSAGRREAEQAAVVAAKEEEAYQTWEGLSSTSPVGLSLSPQASPASSGSGKHLAAPAAVPRPALVGRQLSGDPSSDRPSSSSLLLTNLTNVTLDLSVACRVNGDAIFSPYLVVSAMDGYDTVVTGEARGPTEHSRGSLYFAFSVQPRDSVRVNLRDRDERVVFTLCDPVMGGGGEEETFEKVEAERSAADVLGALSFTCRRFENQTLESRIVMRS